LVKADPIAAAADCNPRRAWPWPARLRYCRRVSDPKHLVRTHAFTPGDGLHVRHPFNPASEVRMFMLSDRAGLARAALSLARVPPGKESFVPHAHRGTEEFVFILAGRGRAWIGAEEYDVGPGDYIGYPIDGTPHHLRNVGDDDLVFLQGGERATLDVVDFPTLGKVSVASGAGPVRFHAAAAEEPRPLTDWLVTTPEPG
jgi:uncharacterized cupin superfamily protein